MRTRSRGEADGCFCMVLGGAWRLFLTVFLFSFIANIGCAIADGFVGIISDVCPRPVLEAINIVIALPFVYVGAYVTGKRKWAFYPKWSLLGIFMLPFLMVLILSALGVDLNSSVSADSVFVETLYTVVGVSVLAVAAFYGADSGQRDLAKLKTETMRNRKHKSEQRQNASRHMLRAKKKRTRKALGKEKIAEAKQPSESSDD